METVWSVTYNLMLIGASSYGLMSKSLRSKKFALAALVLYCANGWFGLAAELVDSETLSEADYQVHKITSILGTDLLVTEVCIFSGVDPHLSYLLLIPAAIDLFGSYVVRRDWKAITNITQLFSIALLFNFSIKDSKALPLVVSGLAFLFAMFTYSFVDIPGYNAIAVFFIVWFLEGKAFEDFGF